ncbi:polyubiquitin 3-like [Pyrus x bretschneideri]|uniref:polyubiquitin 3-like n=1 Tax=Pyrus x bretschneideri TaxID=225117 RepID=UPI00202E02B6|nr:polyubiquitin 3-like [Pyrus x bretschneideri]
MTNKMKFRPYDILVKKTSDKDIIMFKLKSSDTIKHLKAMIQCVEGMPVERQTLVYNGKVLDRDNETLAACNVESWSTVHAIFCSEKINPKVDGVSIHVKVPRWGPVLVDVKPWFTGREIKVVTGSVVGFGLDDFVVSHGEEFVEDCTRISECNLNKNLPFTLLPIAGKFAEVQLDKLWLFHGDHMVYLDDDEKTLGFYHVNKRSTIWVFGSSSKLSIKMPQVGETIALSIYKVSSVMDIKQYICEKMGIPCTSQKLFYKGQLLDDAECLKTYNMERNCVVYAVFRCGDPAEEVEETDEISLTFRKTESNSKENLVKHSHFQEPERKPDPKPEYDEDSFEIKLSTSHTIFDVKVIVESISPLTIYVRTPDVTALGLPAKSSDIIDDVWIPPPMIEDINVTGPNGTITKVDVNPSHIIKAVKEKIEEIRGIPYGIQSLTYGDEELDDNTSIGQYEVLFGSLWALRWKFSRSSWSFFWPSYNALHC